MSKLKNSTKASSTRLSEKNFNDTSDDIISKEEKSPKEVLMENLNKFMPTGYSSKYDTLAKIEANILGLQGQIEQIEELLKPIPRIERKRGKKPLVTPSERKLLKSTRGKLKTQLIIERNNWDKENQFHNESTKDEIERNKNEQLVEQARSGYYIKKYSNTIVSRIKNFFDFVLENDSPALKIFKKALLASKDEKAYTLILEFFKVHQANPFLSSFFSLHKNLQKSYTQLIKDLLGEWNGSNSSHSFKDSQKTVAKNN